MCVIMVSLVTATYVEIAMKCVHVRNSAFPIGSSARQKPSTIVCFASEVVLPCQQFLGAKSLT